MAGSYSLFTACLCYSVRSSSSMRSAPTKCCAYLLYRTNWIQSRRGSRPAARWKARGMSVAGDEEFSDEVTALVSNGSRTEKA